MYSQGAQFFYEFQTKTFNSDTGEFEVDQRGAGVPLVDGNGVPIPLTQLDAVINALETDFFNISQRNEKAEEAYLKSKKINNTRWQNKDQTLDHLINFYQVR